MFEDNLCKAEQCNQDVQMTSSTISGNSNLSSPIDSGVQMLDSESELTSLMSGSGIGCDIVNLDNDISSNIRSRNDTCNESDLIFNCLVDKNIKGYEINKSTQEMTNVNILEETIRAEQNLNRLSEDYTKIHTEPDIGEHKCQKDLIENEFNDKVYKDEQILSNSDIVNQNTIENNLENTQVVTDYFEKFNIRTSNSSPCFSQQLEHYPKLNKSLSDDVFEMEHPIQPNPVAQDMMNVSLTTYELLDYTSANKTMPTEVDPMHVSMSEEVNENLRIQLACESATIEENVSVIEAEPKQNDEQIVFRRQRKKKSKSDTPKKRVSFHEDILNSTKIDDIHINHGFITHEPEVSFSFFQKGFVPKPDVVQGRYSWAAEGDAPYYEKPAHGRKIKSDIYIHKAKFSSTSSSSTGSISSSIDEEDTSDENVVRNEIPLHKLPKTSCLKKTQKKSIDTKVVQEEIHPPKKILETTLLDTNVIFGSLKNILNFSTSVPLAERGVPEGQEDITVYSCSSVPQKQKWEDKSRRRSCSSFSYIGSETTAAIEPEIPIQKSGNLNVDTAKTNLKLTRSEGFYPNYPNNQKLPSNIILCDSNVYEHKGISYSYEYDNFQKTFEQENKPKSSTLYQSILKEFNFFRKKAKEEPKTDPSEDFEIIENPDSSEVVTKVEEVKSESTQNTFSKSTLGSSLSKYASSSKLDWSDNETTSDFSENFNSRHLNSPKKTVSRTNHYTVQSSLKNNQSDDDFFEKKFSSGKGSLTKTSLINRFLRNVTLKKILDVKGLKKDKASRKYLDLYVRGVKNGFCSYDEIDRQVELEVLNGLKTKISFKDTLDKKTVAQIRKELFRNSTEVFLRIFAVRSAYTTAGESKALFAILTNNKLYISSLTTNNTYKNHFVLPYLELNTILVGPSSQTIHFSNYDKDMQCIITTGCSQITNDLICQIEIAMRRDLNKPQLAAVKQLSMTDMVNLRKAICKQTSVDKDEECHYYSIVNVQDSSFDTSELTILSQNKEGPLMFRTQDSKWETAYFILKAGVLYMLSSSSHRVPMKEFPLINGSCQGARRIVHAHRPYTFQIIVDGKSLHLAAPDEYVASEWLQALIHAASGTLSTREKQITQSCSLLMTNEHILTVREAFPISLKSLLPNPGRHDPIKGPQVLSCASIVDLTSFRLPSAEQSWCILEFACREVHECSGDWILYFCSNSELELFISTLEVLWDYNNENGDSFPLSTVPETDPLSKRCVEVYNSLKQSWPLNVVHLQFL